MEDKKQTLYAQEAYETLCTTLDNIGWHYERMDDDLKIMFGVGGDDLPMAFLILVDADRQLIRLLSLLPFQMSDEKRIDGAIATSAINYAIADGSFDFDIETGRILFRMTSSFRESLIGEELFKYMVSVACLTVDRYNDKLCAINDGELSIEDFIKEL